MIYKIYRRVALFFGEKFRLNRFHILRLINEFFRRRLRPKHIMRDGHIFYLDPYDGHNLSLRDVYEPLSTMMAKEKIKKGDTVIDVGASIGYYTSLFSDLVGDRGTAYAYEPDPDTFKLLMQNCYWKTNVIFRNCAAFNSHGTLPFYTGLNSTVNSFFPNPKRGEEKIVMVQTVRLDDIHNEVDFLKIDVEGSEIQVMTGAKRLLALPNIKLLVEYAPWRYGVRTRQVIDFILSCGFKITIVDEKENKIYPLDQLKERQAGWFCNLYCER